MRNIRWTVGRRVTVITCIGLASAVLVALVAWVGAGTVSHDAERTRTHDDARSLVQQLDTRSSELKVDGFKAVTLDDPTTAQADVADDTQQVADLIAALRELDLDPDDKAAVTDLETAFAAYTTSIAEFVDAAVADQDAQRAKAEKIQQANEKMDAVLGGLVDALTGDADEASDSLLDTAHGMRGQVLLFTLLGLAIAGALAALITRSLVRPLKGSVDALQRFAAGDLTYRLEERSSGEAGDLEIAFNQTIESVSAIVTTVAGSAEAVAAAVGGAVGVLAADRAGCRGDLGPGRRRRRRRRRGVAQRADRRRGRRADGRLDPGDRRLGQRRRPGRHRGRQHRRDHQRVGVASWVRRARRSATWSR